MVRDTLSLNVQTQFGGCYSWRRGLTSNVLAWLLVSHVLDVKEDPGKVTDLLIYSLGCWLSLFTCESAAPLVRLLTISQFTLHTTNITSCNIKQ